MFLAPVLYALHAVLTGLAMVMMDLLQVRLGFGFSAGLFDYVLNFGKATRPLLLLPVGAAYFALYYVVFRFCIRRVRPADAGARSRGAAGCAGRASESGDAATAFVAALGGAGNLVAVDACTTRLRLEVGRPDGGRRGGAEGARRARHRAACPTNRCRSCSGRSPTRSPAKCARHCADPAGARRRAAGPVAGTARRSRQRGGDRTGFDAHPRHRTQWGRRRSRRARIAGASRDRPSRAEQPAPDRRTGCGGNLSGPAQADWPGRLNSVRCRTPPPAAAHH